MQTVKIAVFGDSFGCFYNRDLETNWFNVLSQMYKDKFQESIEYDFFAETGSSMFHTYKTLTSKKCNENYDRIIIFITNPGRYPIKVNQGYISSADHLDFLLTSGKWQASKKDRSLIDGIRHWFIPELEEYHFTFHLFLLSNIEEKIKNVILIPCFSNSFEKEMYKKFGLLENENLYENLYQRQLKLLNLANMSGRLEEKTNVTGHLIPEFSKFLGKKIYERLTSGRWNFDGISDIKPKLSREKYFEL